MRYCTVHSRGEIPAGHDWRGRHPIAAHWHQVHETTVAYAQFIAREFGCTSQVQVEHVPCDQCTAKEQA